ncbi:hypothetical protein [Actinomyces sp. MRS3W]|uniref:hypothetical protein n=1 Tax=Actinomyces sp. MRS3W TaxID=2800796 RepID=UPI0028FD82CD|nr:hypothetical protein [Actinomyces sp. MRS3W]MDU0347375.1 hypothetical protein [Actinomyces sp. MRS3W]
MIGSKGRAERYAQELLEQTRAALTQGASLSELSATVRRNALVNPLVDLSAKGWTINALSGSASASPVPDAMATCVAAMLAGDWLLAVTAALLTQDDREREAALKLLQGECKVVERTIREIAVRGVASLAFLPIVTEFCYELVARTPEVISFKGLERTPHSVNELVSDLLSALNRYPVGEELILICPSASHSKQCLEDVLSRTDDTDADPLRVLYAASTTQDALSVPATRRNQLLETERAVVSADVDESLWVRLRYLHSITEYSRGEFNVARALAVEVGQAELLYALLSLDAGDVPTAMKYADKVTGSDAKSAFWLSELMQAVLEYLPSAACAAEDSDGTADGERGLTPSGRSRANDRRRLVLEPKGIVSGDVNVPISIWSDEGSTSMAVLKEAVDLINREHAATSQKVLEQLGECADRLLKRSDAYRTLAKWLRLIQAERLFVRGKYKYAKRIFTYVASLFAKSDTPAWVAEHIDNRNRMLTTIEAEEFAS